MSSKRYATPLRLEVGRSPRLQRLFLLFVALALFSLWLTPLALPYKGGVAILLLTFAWRCWSRRAELGGEVVALTWEERGWSWRQGGREQRLALDGHTFVTPSLILLSLRGLKGRARCHAVIVGGEYDAEMVRRLRVRLHLERNGAE